MGGKGAQASNAQHKKTMRLVKRVKFDSAYDLSELAW